MTLAQPTTLHLRPTVRPDLRTVVEILQSTVDWYAPFVTPEDLDSQHDVDMAWALENFEKRDFYSAVIDGEVVGVLTVQEAHDWLYLGYVYVHADHVGKRIGRRLLDHAAEQARRRGKRGMVLLAHPEATWAVRAYQKYGFQQIAESDGQVLAWNQGWLRPYHEEGFRLWRWTPPTPDVLPEA